MLPQRVLYALSEALIADIFSAQHIAMQQHGRRAVQIDDFRFLKQLHTGAPAVVLTQHEIPIAVNEGQLNARTRELIQCVCDTIVKMGDSIVTQPDFEQIAEDKQSLGLSGRARQEGEKLFGNIGPTRFQMQVGNKQTMWKVWTQGISTRSITTFSTGTSPCGPRLAVAT